MRCCIVNRVALPVRTGQSFTSVERARYFVRHGRYDAVDIYFPYVTDQSHWWDQTLSRREYRAYLYRQYGRHARIQYQLATCTYHPVLRWNTIHSRTLDRIMENRAYQHVIFEDWVSHFFASPLNAMRLGRRSTVFIHHTNFVTIATDDPVARRLLCRVAEWA